jgi:class 3 adenylate cyclase
METLIHKVREMNGNQRSAAERLVGHALQEDQELVIQVIDVDASGADEAAMPDGELPDWCNVYEGLTDEEIAVLERAISRRLDLTRPTT